MDKLSVLKRPNGKGRNIELEHIPWDGKKANLKLKEKNKVHI